MSIYVPHSKIVIAGLDYVQPVVATSYLQVKVIAEVTMPDVLAVDVVTPLDDAVLAFSKATVDALATIDAVSKGISRPIVDTQAIADGISHKSVGKHLADTQNSIDALHYSLTKLVSGDYATAIDAAKLYTVKVFADSLSPPVDNITGKSFTKVLVDSLSFTDHVVANKLYIRAFSDNFSTPDAYLEEFISGVTAEIASASDVYGHVVTKNFLESVVLIDNMDGDIQYSIIKLIGELLSISDGKVIDFATNKSDNVVSSDGGVLSMQDYCDITYFLEDYVGISRTF